ncbi:histidine-type phosphatase [Escherichia coli]
MNKTLIAAAVAGIVLLASNAQAQTVPEGYQLQQVLMMSRHNLRAPLANNGSVLEQSTPNKWPEWDVPGGQLTTKGGVLEVYMGHYMREWLAEQGMVLSKLKNGYQDSLFTSPEVARNVAKPLVSYIDKALVTDRTSAPKITVLVGHDSNIASLLTALDFKPYQLHDQNERTPIGGKIVFQRWHDSKANRDLMKIEYVYQSAEQLRNADALTLQAPAQRVTLELSGCPIDANGFCPMDKFDSVLNEAVK